MTIRPAGLSALKHWLRCCREPFPREKDRILAEILSLQGLMPLLMQQRNGRPWTPDERAQLTQHLCRLRSLSPYLMALLAPGSVLLLPLLAWWLDRRRKKRTEKEQGIRSGFTT
jgi:hypothetical protein